MDVESIGTEPGKLLCHCQASPKCDPPAIERFWSLLRSWLRPHRGISQDELPRYLGFFQFVHNARRRGRALLGALVGALVA